MVKPEFLHMTLSQRTGVAEINTHWSFRFPLLVKMPTRKVSFPKLSGTGMSSLILSSPLLNCRTIVYLNLLVRARDLTSLANSLVGYCHFGVSPVTYTDSDSDGSRIIQPRIPPTSLRPVNGTGFYVVHFGLLRSIRFLS